LPSLGARKHPFCMRTLPNRLIGRGIAHRMEMLG
jgi:hypothetical protein